MALPRASPPGVSNQAQSVSRDDGMSSTASTSRQPSDARRRGNKPLPIEEECCREYLIREMRVLRRARVRLTLGRIGFEAFLKSRRGLGLPDLKPKPVFGHGVYHPLPEGGWLLGTYHPSQQNTSTGVLTQEMWGSVFDTAVRLRDQV